jgi:hypothetical protein
MIRLFGKTVHFGFYHIIHPPAATSLCGRRLSGSLETSLPNGSKLCKTCSAEIRRLEKLGKKAT